MTNIDPFAPADSPQHPANWGKEKPVQVHAEDLLEVYLERFATVAERGPDAYGIPFADLEERARQHKRLLDQYGTEEEREEGAAFVPQPQLLLRAAEYDVEQDAQEWISLFDVHATVEEKDPHWVDDYPSLEELHQRKADAEAAAELVEPPANARKDQVVSWAIKVSAHRGENATFEDLNSLTVPVLRETYGTKQGD